MSVEKRVYVVGAGGHAKVVISTMRAEGYDVDAVFDDDGHKCGKQLLGVPVVGSITDLQRLGPARAVLAVGSNSARKALAARLDGMDWVRVVHPSATLHPTVRLGPGTVVFAGAIIQPDTIIGAHSIVNTGATIDHDCVIGDYVHVAPGAHLAGGVRLDEGVLLGIGSAVIPGVRIGSWATVGAGGVVVKDLDAGVVAVGAPARVVRQTESV